MYIIIIEKNIIINLSLRLVLQLINYIIKKKEAFEKKNGKL